MTLATVKLDYAVCKTCGHYDEDFDSCKWTDLEIRSTDPVEVYCTHYIDSEAFTEKCKRTWGTEVDDGQA